MSTTHAVTHLSGPQLKAIRVLLTGESPAAAARASGVSARTLRDWQQQPDFREAFLEGQTQLLHQVSQQLVAGAVEAIRTLVEICRDPKEKGSVRVAAANKLLTLVLRQVPPAFGLTESAPLPPAPSAIETSILEALERAYGEPEVGEATSPTAPPAPNLPASNPLSPPSPGSTKPSPQAAGRAPHPGAPSARPGQARPTHASGASRRPPWPPRGL